MVVSSLQEAARKTKRQPDSAPPEFAARLGSLLRSVDRTLPAGPSCAGDLRKVLASHRRVRPSFADAWLASGAPADAELVAEYRLRGATVRLLTPTNGAATLYWLTPD